MDRITQKLAVKLLKTGAFSFDKKRSFKWASGAKMPVYNDNRLILSSPTTRAIVKEGFEAYYSGLEKKPNAIAAAATGGIAHGAVLADMLNIPFFYVRAEAKGHGKKKRIEGGSVKHLNILLIEDVFSSGGSAISCIEELKKEGANICGCLSIFNYGFSECYEAFEKVGVKPASLLYFEDLLKIAKEIEFVSEKEFEFLEKWQKNPSGKRGGKPLEKIVYQAIVPKRKVNPNSAKAKWLKYKEEKKREKSKQIQNNNLETPLKEKKHSKHESKNNIRYNKKDYSPKGDSSKYQNRRNYNSKDSDGNNFGQSRLSKKDLQNSQNLGSKVYTKKKRRIYEN